jgi:hypothetical protein
MQPQIRCGARALQLRSLNISGGVMGAQQGQGQLQAFCRAEGGLVVVLTPHAC